MDKQATMGDRIRTLREARGFSQQQLADAVGVTKGAVGQWERGLTKNVKNVTMLALCQVLQTDQE
jgi:transcriptional regulator with XRE-family HTH domain